MIRLVATSLTKFADLAKGKMGPASILQGIPTRSRRAMSWIIARLVAWVIVRRYFQGGIIPFLACMQSDLP
jgi:hypothetical protein